MTDIQEELADLDELKSDLEKVRDRFPNACRGSNPGWEAEGAEAFADTIEVDRDGNFNCYFKIGHVRVYGCFSGRMVPTVLENLKSRNPQAYQALLDTITGANR